MQILIGCAKEMSGVPTVRVPYLTVPQFQREAERNARQMAAYGTDELRDMLGVSAKIAAEVHGRYQSFFDDSNFPLAAIAAYNGVVFRNMELDRFSDSDFDFAGQHLWITSFLYGLLRPLDGIRPYRMEGKIELPDNGMTMFAYWRLLLTDVFIDGIKKDDGVLIDLASSEMRQMFDWNKVERSVTVVKPDFFIEKNGKLTMPSVNAKKCRGAMTSWLIRNKIAVPEQLRDFSFLGMAYSNAASADSLLRPAFL